MNFCFLSSVFSSSSSLSTSFFLVHHSKKGTLFALLMSVYNGAGIIGQETGALLTSALGVTDKDFDNLASLVALCSLSSLLPLPFLGVLREVERAEEEKEAKKEEGEEKRRVDGGDETKYSGAFDKEE